MTRRHHLLLVVTLVPIAWSFQLRTARVLHHPFSCCQRTNSRRFVGTGALAADQEKPVKDAISIPDIVNNSKTEQQSFSRSSYDRFKAALPRRRRHRQDSTTTTSPDADDRNEPISIIRTALPSMLNLAVVPLVNAVDTFYVGRLGNALALAGQAAANQAFFTLFFLVSYLPTITAPRVASAVASGNAEQAQARVCESLFLSNIMGLLGTILLAGFPVVGLSLVLPKGSLAMEFAAPYLRVRALSFIPALISATGFAAYRGLLDTVTPLKVSLFTNLVNLVLDPIFIFPARMGLIGAAVATAISETTGGLLYLRLLLKKSLVQWRLLIKPPTLKSLIPLLLGGASMLGRQIVLNVGFITAGRRAQAMDPTGVSAAAYGIVMQLYAIGIVVQVAMQGTAAALVPASMAKSGKKEAQHVADRIFVWGSIVGVILGATQLIARPWLVPVFSTLPAVQEAVRVPMLLTSILHMVNGPVFAGEGTMLGLGCYRDLMLLTAGGVATMVAALLSPLGSTLNGVFGSILIFNCVQAIAVVAHFLRIGPLAERNVNSIKMSSE